jgi:hypothetical protein
MSLGSPFLLQSKRFARDEVLHSMQCWPRSGSPFRAVSIPSYRQAKTLLGATQRCT